MPYDVRLNLGEISGVTREQAKDIEKLVKNIQTIRTAESQIHILRQQDKIITGKLIKDQGTLTDKEIKRMGVRRRSIEELLKLSKQTGMKSWTGGITTFQAGSTPMVGPTPKRTWKDTVKESAVGFKKGLVDSGFLGGMGKIGAAGVAFGAGLAVFETMSKNSKILSTVMDTIGRLLGLFLDIIFLPMMPIFIWIIRGMHFLLMGLLKLERALGQPLSLALLGTGALLAAILGGKAIDIAVNLLARGAAWLLNALSGLSIPTINILASVGLGLIIGAAVVKILEVTGALDAIYNAGEKIRRDNSAWFQSIYNNAGMAGNALNAMADIMNATLGTGFLTSKKMSEIIASGQWNVETAQRLKEKYGAKVVAAGGTYGGYYVDNKRITEFQTGGVVENTGIALVHRGETVIPSGGGNITLIVNGTLFRSEEELYRNIADKLRRELWRQNV